MAGRRLLVFLTAFAGVTGKAAAAEVRLELARNGRTRYVIAADAVIGETGRFAALELSRYLGQMTGATFDVGRRGPRSRVIALRLGRGIPPDGYTLTVRGDSLVLEGASARAVLFASYDLLRRLGCHWLAPGFSYHEGAHEVIPKARTLVYRGEARVAERPDFAMRKLNVEEGLSHDAASLLAIVAWMPKARFNTMSVPLDYGGSGRVRWDQWRSELAPELARRGLDVEVGGHGYQNFLNASMDGGALFTAHPDWFGRDSTCQPSRATQHVFNTASADAVTFVTSQAVRYMKERPEIAILELWPPDGARWSACSLEPAESTPDRQAALLNTVSAHLRAARPDARLQTIAYNEAKEPPSRVMLDPGILVDVCPIGQNFDYQIDDPRGSNNAQYAALIRNWRGRFGGHLGLYSYFRRYAWLSLPVLLPRYMQHDLRWYASVPMQGISTYAEPGDWYTYELNHLVLGHLAWNTNADVNALIAEYTVLRYGRAAPVAADAYALMEDVVRKFGSIQYATPKSAGDIRLARARIDASRAEVETARARASSASSALERLALMLEYASRDMAIQALRAEGQGEAARPMVEELNRFLTAHRSKGVFLLTGRNDRARVFRHYSMRAES